MICPSVPSEEDENNDCLAEKRNRYHDKIKENCFNLIMKSVSQILYNLQLKGSVNQTKSQRPYAKTFGQHAPKLRQVCAIG
jgi:hypothetical protein